MKPYKAMMTDMFSNSIFIYAKDLLVPFIRPLFRATHSLKYYPKEWVLTETVVLKKPGKPDYIIPAAWQLMVLSNGMARLLNSCRRFKDRQTTLMFNRFYSDPFSIQNGLNQGDPFLGILYLLYNSDLLKIPDIKLGERMLLFIDDAAILVTGKDFSTTHDKLHNIMTRTNGILDWASLHNCKFRVKKFQLLDFTKKKVPQPLNSRRKLDTPCKALRLDNQCIPSMDTTRFLGITLDNKLSWKP